MYQHYLDSEKYGILYTHNFFVILVVWIFQVQNNKMARDSQIPLFARR